MMQVNMCMVMYQEFVCRRQTKEWNDSNDENKKVHKEKEKKEEIQERKKYLWNGDVKKQMQTFVRYHQSFLKPQQLLNLDSIISNQVHCAIPNLHQ